MQLGLRSIKFWEKEYPFPTVSKGILFPQLCHLSYAEESVGLLVRAKYPYSYLVWNKKMRPGLWVGLKTNFIILHNLNYHQRDKHGLFSFSCMVCSIHVYVNTPIVPFTLNKHNVLTCTLNNQNLKCSKSLLQGELSVLRFSWFLSSKASL